jgi:hypothetical protein
VSTPPTPQAISWLLKCAGFERAVITNNSRHHKEHTAGFRIMVIAGHVCVTWWADNRDLASQRADAVQQQVEDGRAMRARYAKAIADAGWPVQERLHSLIVTAQEDTR